MIREYDILGVLVHPYLLALLCSLIAIKPISMLMNYAGVYRRIWHAGLFDTAVFLILFGGIVYLLVPGIAASLFS